MLTSEHLHSASCPGKLNALKQHCFDYKCLMLNYCGNCKVYEIISQYNIYVCTSFLDISKNDVHTYYNDITSLAAVFCTYRVEC